MNARDKTEETIAILKQHASIFLVHIIVNVIMVILEMELLVLVLFLFFLFLFFSSLSFFLKK